MSRLVDYEACVRAFHAKFGHPVGSSPGFRAAALRSRLIAEEAGELCAAIEAGDMVGAVDGLADLLYVTFGTAVAFGVEIGKYFEEVHGTNMRKEGDPMNPQDKPLKPEGWQPPRIAEMLADDGWF